MNILDKVRQPENRKLELKRSLPARAKWLKSKAGVRGKRPVFLCYSQDEAANDIPFGRNISDT